MAGGARQQADDAMTARGARPTRVFGVPLGLLFVMTAVFFRLSRYTRHSLINFGKTADVLIDIEAYKLMMLLPLAFLVLAALQWPRRTRVRLDPPFKLLIALFVFSTASLLWAYNPAYSLPWLLRLAIPFTVYFLVINYTVTRRHLRWWSYLFVLMGFADVIIAAVELPFLFRLWGSIRASDPEILGYIGIYARWAVVAFAFSLHLAAFGESRRERSAGIVGAIVSVITVYFTYRRAALLAVALVVLIYMVLIGRRRRDFVALAVVVALLAGGALLVDPRYAQRIASIGQASDLSSVEGGSLQRVLQFLMGVRIFKEHWLLGIGTGNMLIYTKDTYGTGKWLPHNIYLEFGGELGIFGLGLFLAFVAVALQRGWRAFRIRLAAGDLNGASLAVAVIAALSAMLLYGFFQPIRHDFYIYVLAALASVAYDVAANRDGRDAGPPPEGEGAGVAPGSSPVVARKEPPR